MEASFNSDYDRLLSALEEYSKDQSRIAYLNIFDILSSDTDALLNESTRGEIESILFLLISDVYRGADSLYRPWYVSSFGQMSSLTEEQANVVYGNTAENLARNRAIAIVPALMATIDKRREAISAAESTEEVVGIAEGLSGRLARTESNGAAGSIIEATAVSMFTEGGLYKRWISVGDERVRFNHRSVAAQRPIPINRLYRVGDVLMRFPADPQAFGGNVAGETVNCRCRSLVMPYSANQPNSNSLNQFLLGI
jgi:hypothetical protein